MKLDFALIADHAYADDRGKFFILGQFQYVFAKQVPVVVRKLTLAMRLSAARAETRDGPGNLELELVNADGQPIIPRSPKIPIPWRDVGPAAPASVQTQVVAEMGNIPLPTFGDFSFMIFVNGVLVGSTSFNVQPMPVPPT